MPKRELDIKVTRTEDGKYQAQVIEDGKVVYTSLRSKRETAVWNANNYINYTA